MRLRFKRDDIVQISDKGVLVRLPNSGGWCFWSKNKNCYFETDEPNVVKVWIATDAWEVYIYNNSEPIPKKHKTTFADIIERYNIPCERPLQ